jgi:hypothetical protein
MPRIFFVCQVSEKWKKMWKIPIKAEKIVEWSFLEFSSCCWNKTDDCVAWLVLMRRTTFEKYPFYVINVMLTFISESAMISPYIMWDFEHYGDVKGLDAKFSLFPPFSWIFQSEVKIIRGSYSRR